MMSKPAYRCLASANLPVYTAAGMRILVFGVEGREAEIVALVHKRDGADPAEAVVRMHSTCVTGDVFGSMKCDCGAQLRIALDTIAQGEHGVLLYLLHHEGRGIGLVNKIRAYALQDLGLDTVEANTALGFEPDSREFEGAAAVLLELGISRVRLLTNNPSKASGLEAGGVTVVERIQMDVPTTEYNRDYLEVKRRYFGHTPMRDPVTECLTPQAFAEIFEVQFANLGARDQSLAMISIVVESYGEVLAQHGRLAAERLMSVSAGLLKPFVRKAEPLTLAGDDRFMLILPGAKLDTAMQVAQRMTKGIAGHTFDWGNRTYPLVIRITASPLAAEQPSAGILREALRTVAEP